MPSITVHLNEMTMEQVESFTEWVLDNDIDLSQEDYRTLLRYRLDIRTNVEPAPKRQIIISRPIRSETDSLKSYMVTQTRDDDFKWGSYWTCTCPDYQFRGGPHPDAPNNHHHCKHIRSVKEY